MTSSWTGHLQSLELKCTLLSKSCSSVANLVPSVKFHQVSQIWPKIVHRNIGKFAGTIEVNLPSIQNATQNLLT
jgi:hypothetical protein